jgi:hypothetical protein
MTARVKGADRLIVDLSSLKDFHGDIFCLQSESWRLTTFIWIIFAVMLLISGLIFFYLGPNKKITVSMDKPELDQVKFRTSSERLKASDIERSNSIQPGDDSD